MACHGLPPRGACPRAACEPTWSPTEPPGMPRTERTVKGFAGRAAAGSLLYGSLVGGLEHFLFPIYWE